ncbi:HD domain-containing protein [Evansella sp. LMS18]|uniref:HD domain-containing protein n=1 Tax=Evansella sp. LMS18 TaxID=2924033 RepID=UPI0020D12F4D|nr:HD domain-containing protein [Evansella sp. LMS18]UTR13030.1 HD domain-containing protein [Evansella sp. LMS18]
MVIHKAVAFASEAHAGQVRKTSDLPYVTHPVTAALFAQPFLTEADFPAEMKTNITCAVILHDVWEDTEIELAEIEHQFGKDITELVRGASEADKKKSWTERKTETINKAGKASLSLKYVICADKLHNLISMEESMEIAGESMWESFKKGRDKQKWYYESLYEALVENTDEPPFFLELKKQIETVFPD